MYIKALIPICVVVVLLIFSGRSEGTPNEAIIPLDDISAIWVKQHDNSWISYSNEDPDFVNKKFFELYAPQLLTTDTLEPASDSIPSRMTRKQLLELRQKQWYEDTDNNATNNFPLQDRYPGVASYCSTIPNSIEPKPLAIRGSMTGDGGYSTSACLHEGGLLFVLSNGMGNLTINLKIMTKPGHRWPSTSERAECPDTPHDPDWNGHGQVEWRLNGGLLDKLWGNHHPYGSGRTFDIRSHANVHLPVDGLNTITAKSCQVK